MDNRENKYVTLLKTQIVFIVQVLVLLSIIIAALVNLTIGTENRELWLSFLSICLSIMLPNPRLATSTVTSTEFDTIDGIEPECNSDDSEGHQS